MKGERERVVQLGGRGKVVAYTGTRKKGERRAMSIFKVKR